MARCLERSDKNGNKYRHRETEFDKEENFWVVPRIFIAYTTG